MRRDGVPRSMFQLSLKLIFFPARVADECVDEGAWFFNVFDGLLGWHSGAEVDEISLDPHGRKGEMVTANGTANINANGCKWFEFFRGE